MKQEFIGICECKKKIKGFSEHHLKKNLEIHKKLSREHKDRLNVLKKNKINSKGMNKNQIADLLLISPIMIYDLNEIGRNYEKKIMVS